MGQRALADKQPPRLFVNTDIIEVRQGAFGTGCKGIHMHKLFQGFLRLEKLQCGPAHPI